MSETKRFGRFDMKKTLWAAVAVLAIGLLAFIISKPTLLVTGISLLIDLAAITLPLWITAALYRPSPEGESSAPLIWITIALVLFFGVMLSVTGVIGMPYLLDLMAPTLCPVGFNGIKSDVVMRQYDLPGIVLSINRIPVCTGELGDYQPGALARLASGTVLYLLYCALYFAVVTAVRWQRLITPNRYAAQGVILAIFIPLLFLTLLNPPVRSILSRPLNRLIYRGQAVSLVEAVKRHRLDMIGDLLSRGGDIHAQNGSGETALSMAQRYGDREALALFESRITGGSDAKRALFDRGIVFDEGNFFKSVAGDDIEAVNLFLDAGMEIDAVSSSGIGYGNTALSIAAANGHMELMRLLLDRGADVNRRGESGWTPLQAASITTYKRRQNGQCDDGIIRRLIERGADVNKTTRDGDTALTMAARVRCFAIVRTLVEKGADVNARTEIGYSSLLHAVEVAATRTEYDPLKKERVEVVDRESYDLVKFLLEHGADPNVNIYIGSYAGMTPLRMARQKRVREVVELLERYHARE